MIILYFVYTHTHDILFIINLPMDVVFYFLAIVNDVTVYMGIQYLFKFLLLVLSVISLKLRDKQDKCCRCFISDKASVKY